MYTLCNKTNNRNGLSSVFFQFVFVFSFLISFHTHATPPNATTCLGDDGVLITVIIDALSIETSDPNITINQINILDSSWMPVYTENGCYSNHCAVHTHSLNSGYYLVQVVTSDGERHAQWVFIQ